MSTITKEQLNNEIHILQLQHKLDLVQRDIDEVQRRIEDLEENTVTVEAFAPIKKLHQKIITVVILGLVGVLLKEIIEKGGL